MAARQIALLAVTLGCALVLLVASAAVSARFQLASETSQPALCVPDDETREKVRAIMLQAMDEALKDHIVRLHETWMKDDTGQPGRAINGVQRGVRAYLGGRAAGLRWNPPTCP